MSEPLFAVIGDPHIIRPRYVTTQLLREKIVFLNTVKDLRCVLVTGDISHEATPEQFNLAKSMLDRLKASYVCCAGNHDMPANTKDLSGYRTVFGCEEFASRIGKYNLLVLAPGSGPPLNPILYQKGPSILLMHNAMDPALKPIFKKHNVKCIFQGHHHKKGHKDVHSEGIRYITCAAYELGMGRLENPITYARVAAHSH